MHRWMLWGGLLAMSSVAYAEEAGSTPEAPAKVCIRRAVGMSGWAVPLVLRQGDEVLEDFAVNEQRCFDVDPGTQAFEATYWATVRKTERPNAKAALELSPGDCRYLKVDFGFWGVRLDDTDNRGFEEAARCDVRGRRRLRR